MRIDIDNLTETELIDLSYRIVERWRFLIQARPYQRPYRDIDEIGA